MGTPAASSVAKGAWSVADQLSFSNVCITAIGILINALLAWWIVKSIQSKQQNRRVLKDYCIAEIKDIRTEYRAWLNNLHSGRVVGSLALAWFKLMNIKVQDVMNLLHQKFDIDPYKLQPYQIDLPDLVTNNIDYINQYNSGGPITFSTSSQHELIKFQQDNAKLFNQIIAEINEKS